MEPLSPTPSSSPILDALSKPQPRPPKSPTHEAQIRIRNRRREYLTRHPEYFKSSELELAAKDPLLYDTLVRRFQSAAEREAEGRSKGYGRVLESSLLRGEARLERLAADYTGDGQAVRRRQQQQPRPGADGSGLNGTNGADSGADGHNETPFMLDASVSTPPADKDEGRSRWEAFLRERFVAGGDDEFDYMRVDGDEELDVQFRTDEEERWFDEEEPAWVGQSVDAGGGEGREGETGVQDF